MCRAVIGVGENSYENRSPRVGLRSGSIALEEDLVAEPFEPPDAAPLDGLPVALQEVVRAELLIGCPPLQQIVHADEDAVAHRHHRLLPTKPTLEPAGL